MKELHSLNSLIYTMAAGAVAFMTTNGFGKVIESIQG